MQQYMFAERRMGACFRMADIDSSWLFSEHACDGMIGEPGLEGLARLVTVDSSQKNEFIKSEGEGGGRVFRLCSYCGHRDHEEDLFHWTSS